MTSKISYTYAQEKYDYTKLLKTDSQMLHVTVIQKLTDPQGKRDKHWNKNFLDAGESCRTLFLEAELSWTIK